MPLFSLTNFPTRLPCMEREGEIENARAMASPIAVGFGDTPPVRGTTGHRPTRRDGAGQAARFKPRTQGGGFGGGKGLCEHDAREAVSLRRNDAQQVMVMAEDVRQVASQVRPCLDRVAMIRERPELHDIPAAVVPFERGTGRLRRSLVPGVVAWCLTAARRRPVSPRVWMSAAR